MKRVFFHIHIWKTAGTTFLDICRQNFGEAFRRDIMLIQNWFLSRDQLRWLLDYHGWLRCYSCHMLSGELPWDVDDTEVVGIAFVRNPVNRFISSYTFQRGDTYRGGIAKANDFDAFCHKALVETDNPFWRNGQTYILGGSRTASGVAEIAERMRQGRMVVLPMERFDECCMVLERLFPDEFTDCSYTRRNVSRQKTILTDQQQAAIAQYMDLDIKLMALANDYLDTALDRLLPDAQTRGQYMDDFRRRCAKKQAPARLSG